MLNKTIDLLTSNTSLLTHTWSKTDVEYVRALLKLDFLPVSIYAHVLLCPCTFVPLSFCVRVRMNPWEFRIEDVLVVYLCEMNVTLLPLV